MPIPIHVAVGVLRDPHNRVLIAQRPAHVHQGGCWEFPGGKVEPGETAVAALRREWWEEVGVHIHAARPLIQIRHVYPEYAVLLDVFQASAFSGKPHGKEGQPVAWVAPETLGQYTFPAANRAIVTAAQLPDRYLITPPPDPKTDATAFLAALEESLASGVRLAQLRAPGWDAHCLEPLARETQRVCARYGASLLLNAAPETAIAWGLDGAHLTSQRLMALRQRPLPNTRLLGASCHTQAELEHAQRLGVDFCVLGPVRATPSHPGVTGIGWTAFRHLAATAALPVYALGGLDIGDAATAWDCGAQGIAGIRGLWGRHREA